VIFTALKSLRRSTANARNHWHDSLRNTDKNHTPLAEGGASLFQAGCNKSVCLKEFAMIHGAACGGVFCKGFGKIIEGYFACRFRIPVGACGAAFEIAGGALAGLGGQIHRADGLAGDPGGGREKGLLRVPDGMRVKLREFAPLGSRVFYPHDHEPAKGRSPEGLFLSPIMGLRVTNSRSQPPNLTRMPARA
jgi:hypothetical protein